MSSPIWARDRKETGAQVTTQGGGALQPTLPDSVRYGIVRVPHEGEHQQSGEKAGAA